MGGLSYCGQSVFNHDRDRFRTGLFVPAPAREGLLALYALNCELAQIGAKITEEMIGHIRLAWWQEALDGLYAAQPPRGHPVLEALGRVVEAGHMPQVELTLLLQAYRSAFPEAPQGIEAIMEKISVVYLRLACQEAEIPWRNAEAMTARHRLHYGTRRNGWLALKLLLAGM